MQHPLVSQLRFTRREFKRCLKGVPDGDALKRVGGPRLLNSLGWSVGHLAWQEQKYFLYWGTGRMPFPDIDKTFRSGAPATTPDLAAMLVRWGEITALADPWLDTLSSADLAGPYTKGGATQGGRRVGDLLQRVIYHYWLHLGENLAVRKLLGHEGLGQFVGNIDAEAPYTPEVEG